MPSYAVDSERQPMTATGIVEPVREWDEGADGKRRPSQRQARSETTGMLLWGVEVLYVTTVFGRQATVTARVTVGCEAGPAIAPLTPIGFTSLVAEVRTNKAGGLVESWSAETIARSVTAPAAGPAGPAGSGDGKPEGRAGSKPPTPATPPVSAA
jgi:hypothetical protein